MNNLSKNSIVVICLLLGVFIGSLFMFLLKPKEDFIKKVASTLNTHPELVADLITANPELFVNAIENAKLFAKEEPKSKQTVPSLSGFNEVQKPQVIEFYNLACLACKTAYNTMKDLKVKDKYSVSFKHIHSEKYPQASIVAQFLEVLYQYNPITALNFLDKIFENQQNLIETDDVKEFISTNLRAVGVSEVEELKLLELIKEEKIFDKLAAYREEARALKITATPSFIIKNKVYQGMPPREIFKNILGIKK